MFIFSVKMNVVKYNAHLAWLALKCLAEETFSRFLWTVPLASITFSPAPRASNTLFPHHSFSQWGKPLEKEKQINGAYVEGMDLIHKLNQGLGELKWDIRRRPPVTFEGKICLRRSLNLNLRRNHHEVRRYGEATELNFLISIQCFGSVGQRAEEDTLIIKLSRNLISLFKTLRIQISSEAYMHIFGSCVQHISQVWNPFDNGSCNERGDNVSSVE